MPINTPNLIRNYGLELPVFDGGEHVIRSGKAAAIQLDLAAASGEDKVLRQTRVYDIGATSLKEILETADKLFDADAEAIEARVVGHTWGLYRSILTWGNYIKSRKHERLIPAHHILVAEVDLISTTSPMRPEQENDFRTTPFKRINGRRWAERKARQFKNGVAPGEASESLWLLDIEPMLF